VAAERAPSKRSDLLRVEAEVAQAEGAVERYYSAFESGGLPETRFISRVQALETLLTELRARLEDLRESERKEAHVAPTAEVMRNAEEAVCDAIRNETPGQRKALLKELVVEVRVESRDSIILTFRIPTTPVRVVEAVVGRGGLEQPTSALCSPKRCGSLSRTPSVVAGVMWRD
jgi:site-specific DNA recombinase